MQNTEPLCKEELLPEILLLLRTSTGEEEETPANEEELLPGILLLLKTPKCEEEEETPANEEELPTGQDATIVPPKARHDSAGISAQPVAYLQGTEPPGKEELLEEKPLDTREEELAVIRSQTSSPVSESLSPQENSKPVAITCTAKTKNLFIFQLLRPASTHPRQTFGEKLRLC
jgi:hypothetical protein